MDEADISGSGTKFFDSFVGFAFCGLGTFCWVLSCWLKRVEF